MSDTLKSPFKCGGQVVTFPAKVISGKLIVRIDNTALTDKAVFKFGLHGGTVAADNADGYLMGGEAFEFNGSSLPKGSSLQVLNTVGDPDIYWYLENI